MQSSIVLTGAAEMRWVRKRWKIARLAMEQFVSDLVWNRTRGNSFQPPDTLALSGGRKKPATNSA